MDFQRVNLVLLAIALFVLVPRKVKAQKNETSLSYQGSAFYGPTDRSFGAFSGGNAKAIGIGFHRRIKSSFSFGATVDIGRVLDYDLRVKEPIHADLWRIAVDGRFYFLTPFKRLHYFNRFWQPYLSIGYTYWNMPSTQTGLVSSNFFTNTYGLGTQLEVNEFFRLQLSGLFNFSLSPNMLHNNSFTAGITYRWGTRENESFVENLCPYDSSYVRNLNQKIASSIAQRDSLERALNDARKASSKKELALELRLRKEELMHQKTKDQISKLRGAIDSLEKKIKTHEDTTLRDIQSRKLEWVNMVFYDSVGERRRSPIFPEDKYLVRLSEYDAFPNVETLLFKAESLGATTYIASTKTGYVFLAAFSRNQSKADVLMQARQVFPASIFF